MTKLTQKEQISQLLKNGESIGNTALKAGVSTWQVRKHRREHHIVGNNSGIFKNDEDFEKAKVLYETGHSFTDIAALFNCSVTGISDALQSRGVITRGNVDINGNSYNKKYSCNDDYFETIDTERKAYWLGYLLADGYNNEKDGRISFGQSEKDSEIVHKFKEDIQATNPIRVNKIRKNKVRGKTFISNPFHVIKVSSKKMSEDLAKWGCGQNKTFSVVFPNIKESLKVHLIRGYFDGDGSVINTKDIVKTAAQFNILGTKEFLISIQDELIKIGLSRTKISPARKNSKISQLVYGGINNIKAFYNYLYSEASIYLPRKKKTFERVFKIYEERDSKTDLEETQKAQKITNLYKEGKSYREIEKITGYSRSTYNDLINKVSDVDTIKKELLDKRNKEIIKLHTDGLSARKIEEKLHVSRKVISEILYHEKV